MAACALLFCACAAAQSSSWSAVRGIAAGASVEARLVNGAKVTGKFVAAYAAGVELRTSPDATRYIPRVAIRKLYLYPARRSAAGRDAWIGLGVGATAGAVYGVAKANCQTGPGGNGSPNCQSIQGRGAAAWGAAFGLLGAIAGDVAGAVAGRLHRPRMLLYWRNPRSGRRGRNAPARGAPTATAAPTGSAAHGALLGAGPSPAAGGASRLSLGAGPSPAAAGASGLSPGAGPSPAEQAARSMPNAWAAVRGLAAGSRVEARLASGAKVKGRLVSASATGIELRTPHTIRYIRRSRIRTLTLTGRRHVVRDAAIGFGAGAIGGATYGAVVSSGDCGPPPAPGAFYGYQPCQRVAGAAVGAALFGAVGAIGGALIGLVNSPRKVIYRFSAGQHDHATTAKRGKAILTAAPAAASGPARN